jgi:hypothetical protein
MDRPVCDVSWDPQVGCVTMEWHGYATTEAFREANARVLAAIRERGAGRVLADVRDFKLIHAEDQDWLIDVWIPRAVAAGMRVCAMVMPRFYFNRVAVESVTQRLDPKALRVQFFEDREAARRWLETA